MIANTSTYKTVPIFTNIVVEAWLTKKEEKKKRKEEKKKEKKKR